MIDKILSSSHSEPDRPAVGERVPLLLGGTLIKRRLGRSQGERSVRRRRVCSDRSGKGIAGRLSGEYPKPRLVYVKLVEGWT